MPPPIAVKPISIVTMKQTMETREAVNSANTIKI
jgi:hypothetical protein